MVRETLLISSRKSLAITVDYALKAADVVATMQHSQALRGTPKRIQVDNGSEFISLVLDRWAYEQGVTRDIGLLTSRQTHGQCVH